MHDNIINIYIFVIMKTKKGRKPLTEGIDSLVLEKWIKENDASKAIIKCQALFSLKNGAKVSEVCRVLNVTRESLRVWRNQFKKDGIDGLISNKKRKGRKTYFTNDIKYDLQKKLKKSPENIGYDQKQWDGKIVARYLNEKKGINISIRTAQNWINKLNIREGSRIRIKFK